MGRGDPRGPEGPAAPERANARDAGNVLATMVRHPELTRAYLRFNAYLLMDSTLSPRVREVALLRTVHRRDCDYLWSHHIPIARRAGLTPTEIDAIRDGELTEAPDRVVIRAVDELDERSTISDATWAELGEHATTFTHDCVQLHGGIGVTWEHDPHLSLRRITLYRTMFGTPADHHRAICTRLRNGRSVA